jgi:hypothetical protein
MLLTGALTVVAPGSSVQVVIAIIVIMINMLIVLKYGPFADPADDFLSFATSIQMVFTLLVAILLMTDQNSAYYDATYMDAILIVVNSFSLIALTFSIAAMHPKVRAKLNRFGSDGKSAALAKVTPVDLKTKQGETSKSKITPENEALDLKTWTPVDLPVKTKQGETSKSKITPENEALDLKTWGRR